MRAISRFASFSRALFSSAPVADWKRRLNSSCRRSWSAFSSSSSVMSLRSLALKEIRLPLHELRLHGELRPRETQRFLRQLLGHAGELEHHAARLHDGDPVLGRALAGAHADRKSTRLNSSHVRISYAVFCLKKKRQAPRRSEEHKNKHQPTEIAYE